MYNYDVKMGVVIIWTNTYKVTGRDKKERRREREKERERERERERETERETKRIKRNIYIKCSKQKVILDVTPHLYH